MNKQNKITRGLFLAFLALFMLIPSGLQDTHIVNANVAAGSGGVASDGKVGKWYYVYGGSSGSGNTEAWKKWRKYQSSRTDSELSRALRGVGNKGIGGWGNQSLETSCKRSQYIWWYGGQNTKRWHTEIGRNAHPTKKEMRKAAPDDRAVKILNVFFKKKGNGWGKPGGTVIICSGSLVQAAPPKIPITITGDTKYFIYNGKQHKVTTWKRSGKVKKGHTVKAKALGTRTNPGKSNVNVTNARVVDSNGKKVSSQYKIKTKKGKIYVRAIPDGPDKRCVTKSTETVKGYTENKVTVTPGFLPEGAPPLGTLNSTKDTEAKYKLDSLPKVGQSKSTWDTWKKDFENKGKDTSTNDITSLNNHNQAIGKYGGVLNVTRTHKIVEVEATLCQPQKRKAKLNSKNKAVWGKWTNDGELQIEKIHDPKPETETYSYQILGVNCNVPGVEKVKKVHKVEDWSYGNGQASALLETEVVEGTPFPLGTVNDGLGGETATDSFYTDGPSCQDQFANACVSEKLDASAKNDANNNLQINPLFTHEDETEHGYPNNKDELVFFRDNEDRTVRADVWYPKNMSESGLITKQNEPAEKTIVKLYDGGTPEIDITTIETSTGSNKETKIDKFNKEFTINDHVNKFNMKSQWASDENKPYELGIDWVYKAEAENNIPTKLNGYKLVDTGTYTADPFEVHCQFMNNTGEYAAQIPKNPFINSKIEKFSWDDKNAIRVLFSRSVSDKSRQSDESKE